jgi:hypothetical protein
MNAPPRPAVSPAPRPLNPSPKTRFMESGLNISNHKKLVDSPEFQVGADYAMLQYQVKVTSQITNPDSAVAAGLKMLGALEFLETLKLLSESPRRAPLVTSDNLNSARH